MGYSLQSGVSFCFVGNRLIFLDLNGDRYICLPAAAEQSFQKLCDGEPLDSDDRHRLGGVCAGILVEAEQSSLPRACMPPPPATASLLEKACSPVSVGDMLPAFAHLLRASAALRLLPLRLVMSGLAKAKTKILPTSAGSDDRAGMIAAAFQQVALIATPLDKCLPRSIAVASRCIALGVSPTLVVGVKLQPFAAHCWVQAGQRILNERIDGIREFTPILVI